MKFTRRHSLQMLLLALGGCASGATGTGVTIALPPPPTLSQVQSWMETASQELPGFLTDLEVTNQLTAAQQAVAVSALAKFQVASTTVMQMQPATNADSVLNDAAAAAVALLGASPKSAPFIPLVAGLQLVIGAYLGQTPVVDPTTSIPIPTPAPPTTAALAAMHAQTRSMAR